MSSLKSSSCSAHWEWLAAGRPGKGPVFDAKRVSKALYRKRIRDKRMLETEHVSNSLHDALINLKTTFGKFGRKSLVKNKILLWR